ncbi:MarR family transcriptional regulator [uncultured Shimia sp.]|uniref:MarR family winged helix-turn-helix transcriptional regulator n=1 Tax=uncultured Shimia sp. TaxID=573152 RepID=UPI0026183711|nr:MarR family transcriptional regulator [uncultured Shimia sp.]
MKIHGMAGHLIRRLNQISTQTFSKHIQNAGHDLTSVQFAAMEAIAMFPGIDQAGVAAKIAYDRATIGGVIDRLVKKGFVARTVSKQDRRAREVRLTSQGEALLRDIHPLVEALQADILENLTPQERAMFMKLATKAVNLTRNTEQ